jgi:hypothetical protein
VLVTNPPALTPAGSRAKRDIKYKHLITKPLTAVQAKKIQKKRWSPPESSIFYENK